MTTSVSEVLFLSFVMAAAIYFCRVFPFLFFRGKTGAGVTGRKAVFLSFVEKTVPPAAMTVLALNALAGPVKSNPGEIIPALIAAVFTVSVHLWKRNPLISIFGGTALFMVLQRLIGTLDNVP